MTAGAGMSRFVLLSAALHLGALAALSYGTARPGQFPPPTLSVTLNAPTRVTAEPVRHSDPQPASAISRENTTGKNVEHSVSAKLSRIAAREAPRNVFAPVMTQARANSEANDGEEDDRNNPPSPPANRQRATPAHEKTQENVARQTTNEPAQQIDTAMLASRLEGQLRDALSPYFAYPIMARRNGWEGQVRVGLRVEADGRLSHVRIAHSSGHRLLDRAALSTLNRITTVPKAAGWLDGRHFDMVLPIDYRLIDGQS
jgi:periplasmic protein TonB